MKGRVIKSTGSWYAVMDHHMHVLECRMKGNIRLKGSRSTNPIAVGDVVEFDIEAGTGQGVISSIEDRKNYIIRKSINLSKKSHVLAANIDHVYVLVTVSNPRTPYGFIDRMLVTAEAYGIPASIIFNKQDAWDEKDKMLALEMMDTYQTAGYETVALSALNESDMNLLREKMKGRVNLLIGHSGTGKSTIINSLNPSLNIKTAPTSLVHMQGKHTTTFAEMHPVTTDTFIIDTPGIREFGLIDMNKYELGHYFPEIRHYMQACRFHNCKHLNEPDCAVIAAYESGEMAASRYYNYLSILDNQNIFS
jgi:ribosome biogenesis GTPase